MRIALYLSTQLGSRIIDRYMYRHYRTLADWSCRPSKHCTSFSPIVETSFPEFAVSFFNFNTPWCVLDFALHMVFHDFSFCFTTILLFIILLFEDSDTKTKILVYVVKCTCFGNMFAIVKVYIIRFKYLVIRCFSKYYWWGMILYSHVARFVNLVYFLKILFTIQMKHFWFMCIQKVEN